MEIKTLKNKEGQVLKTEEGRELQEFRFAVGDVFIPMYNSILENEREVEVKGKKQKITDYKLKCRVKNIEGEVVVDNAGGNELFVTLTPTQAKSLKKKIEDGVELNQNLFIVYTYESEKYGEQIGVGLKGSNKPAKTFDDFDNEVEEEDEE